MTSSSQFELEYVRHLSASLRERASEGLARWLGNFSSEIVGDLVAELAEALKSQAPVELEKHLFHELRHSLKLGSFSDLFSLGFKWFGFVVLRWGTTFGPIGFTLRNFNLIFTILSSHQSPGPKWHSNTAVAPLGLCHSICSCTCWMPKF